MDRQDFPSNEEVELDLLEAEVVIGKFGDSETVVEGVIDDNSVEAAETTAEFDSVEHLQQLSKLQLADMGFSVMAQHSRFYEKWLNPESEEMIAAFERTSESSEVLIAVTERVSITNRQLITNLSNLVINANSGAQIKTVVVSSEELEDLIRKSLQNAPAQPGEGKARGEQSAAKRKFVKVVEQGVERGAADFVLAKTAHGSYYSYKIDGAMTAPQSIGLKEADLMVNSMFQTVAENMTGTIDDDEIRSDSIPFSIVPMIDGVSTYMDVRLRAQKVSAHGGYKLWCRIIKTGQQMEMPLSELGFPELQFNMLKRLAGTPSGIVIIVGPTGHGKSVTLKAFYEQMDPSWNLIICEDPVEYIITHPHATQQSVVEEKGLTPQRYIKSSLRQFPNVVGISEIRDEEVAQAIVNMALSGHLMVSTLHAHDTLSALPRLEQIGVSYKTMALRGLFSAVISQRLLPKLCSCKQPAHSELYGNHFVRKIGGCDRCDRKGVKGRQLVGEIFIFDGKVRQLLNEGDVNGIEPYIRSKGWRSMMDAAQEKVREGVVDPADVFALLGDENNTLEAQFDYLSGAYRSGQEANI